MVRVVTTLRGGNELPPEVAEDERASGRRRALQGIPADEVVAAYRAVLGVLRDAFLTEAAAVGVAQDAVLLGVRRLWDLTDHYSSELVSARHQVDLDMVRREERGRQAFLRSLLAGSLLPTEIAEGGGSAFGLNGVRDLWVLRARADAGLRAEEVLRLLDPVTRTPRLAPLLGPADDDVAGVVARSLDTASDGLTIALDGPVPVEEVRAAFVRASALLDVAGRYAITGVVTAERLSLRVAVAQNEQLGRFLREKYVGRLDPSGSMTPLLVESVRVYLDENRSIPAAARALNLHVNTLRYRLERFQALTGADLQDTLTILEVWWALQFDRLH